jgi:two-component system sensor histidine kinase SenX3
VPVELLPALNALPGLVILVDVDGRIAFASAAVIPYNLVGRERVRSSRLRRLITDVRESGQPQQMSYDRARVEGAERDEFRVYAAPLPEQHVLLTLEDVSEERRLDKVRRDFVANVSHELKTPVSALSLLAEAVQEASDDPDAVRNFTERMKVEAQRLATLVNDLLDLSMLQGEGLKAVDPIAITDITTAVIDAVHLLAYSRGITIEANVDESIVVFGEKSQLVMALRNLMTNAVGYSPEHSTIELIAAHNGEVVEISVRDHGEGIPEAEQPRIFERFYRVDPARSRATGGTGLGLAIVKHVCENHGGDCTVISAAGEGAMFTMRLPAFVDPSVLVDTLDDDDLIAEADIPALTNRLEEEPSA